MIPVPGLDSVRCAWVEIKAEGFVLHGFLVYLVSDHYFPEYLNGEGLGDLDLWTGDDCAVFVVQTPSAKWIDYTRQTDHPWWNLFGHLYEIESRDEHILRDHGDVAVLEVGGATRTMREVFAPRLNEYHHAAEIAKILRRFNLHSTEHPCLILFKDLKDRRIWSIDLRDLVDLPQRQLRKSLQRWFGGRQFASLLKEARNA